MYKKRSKKKRKRTPKKIQNEKKLGVKVCQHIAKFHMEGPILSSNGHSSKNCAEPVNN